MKKKRTFLKVAGLVLLLIFFSGITTFCQEEGHPKGKITLNFQKVKLGAVLKVLTQKTDMKFITSTELAEKPITLYLPEVTGEEALNVLLKANGLYLEKEEGTNIYLVKGGEETPQFLTRTFFCEYARAVKLEKVIQPNLSPEGKVIVDERTNSLTIKDSPQNMRTIEDLIASLDKAVPQVLIEAAIVELSDDGLKELGIRWNMEVGVTGASRDVAYPWERDVSLTNIHAGAVIDAPQFIMGTISFRSLTASLKLLETKGLAKLLANPRVTTLNDNPAEIKITRNIVRAIKTVYNPETGVPISREPIYGDVGITLITTPHVNREGFITLEVEPTVSSAEASPFFAEAVDTHQRSAKTTIMVKDGQTIVIGGLIRSDTSKTVERVPILGHILPFLFSYKRDSITKSELVIFITPRVLSKEAISKMEEDGREKVKEIAEPLK